MTQHTIRPDQKRQVEAEVRRLFGKSAAYAALPPAERQRVLDDTTAIANTLVANQLGAVAPTPDPFAVPPTSVALAGPGEGGMPLGGLGGLGGAGGGTAGGGATNGAAGRTFTGGATAPPTQGGIVPTKEFGSGIALGVQQTGQLLREVNFPAFVAELVQGVFQAVVDASIQQMKAYAELVQSVAMSLNDFRDQNVTENQARDHLVAKYPTLMQVNIQDGQPTVGLRPGADDAELPNFRQELGLDEDVDSLDDETIEQLLVPAARNDLARSRQDLLRTVLLMGINRIVVTDGKINAKLRFDFRARDTMQSYAQNYDYGNFGTATVQQREYESKSETGEGYKEAGSGGSYDRGRGRWAASSRSGESSRWTRGSDQTTQAPVIYLTKQENIQTQAEIAAEGQLRSDVTLSFKSETVDLNKLATPTEMLQIEQAQRSRAGAGPGTAATAGTAGAAAGNGAGGTQAGAGVAGGSTTPAGAGAR